MQSATFWDKVAIKYAASPVSDPDAYEQTLTEARRYLKPSDHLLEVGCGTGTTALKLRGDVAHLTATDISPKMIDIARAKEGADAIAFAVAEADAPVAGAPFDAIAGFNLLHLLREPEQVVQRLARMLKPGGYLITKSGCLKEMNIGIRLIIPLMQLVRRAPYVGKYRAADFERMMTQAGLEIIDSRTFNTAHSTRFIVARKPE